MSAILIVDDKTNVRNTIAAALNDIGFTATACGSGAEALELLSHHSFDVVITDLKMPEMNGMELLKIIKDRYPTIEVIMLTGYGTIEEAVEAMRLGAIDFVSKPAIIDELELKIQRALKQQKMQIEKLVAEDEALPEGYRLIGRSPIMIDIRRQIEKIAPTNVTVLIRGSSGTGKELAARSIHALSPRAAEPFVAVACAAIPESLLEAELFGFEKGAFTGANKRKIGKFQLANNGTIFLDEIGEINAELQVKLLRFLQEFELTRIGSNTTIKVNVRVIAATNKNLEDAIQGGSFRKDLFYRLNVLPLTMPNLNTRIDDIPILIEHFIQKYTRRLNIAQKSIHPDAIHCLQQYSWPGNVRELENTIERAMVMSENIEIQVHDLPQEIRQQRTLKTDHIETSESELCRTEQNLSAQVAGYEKRLICSALKQTDYNIKQAAELLNINRSTLQFKIKKYGIEHDK